MILCVSKEDLQVSDKVQKKIDIESIMNGCTYFQTLEEAYKDGYVPLNVSVIIRTINDNRVVEFDMEDHVSYYTNIEVNDQFVHKGYDLLMFLTSIGVMFRVNYAKGFDEVMLEHSQYQTLGVYNPNPDFINPIVVTQVLISDEGAKLFEPFLKGDSRFVSISDMRQAGNLKAILDEIILVKEVENNDAD